MKKVEWLFDKFGKFNNYLGVIAGIVVLFIIGVMFLEVIMRYVFNAPTKFALEVSLMCQQAFVAIAATYVLQIEGHVSLTLVTERLSEFWNNCLLSITSVISSAVCGYMCFQMVEVTQWSLKTEEITPLLEIYIWPFKLVLTIGFALLTIGFIARSYKYYKRIIAINKKDR